jgi:hypothetical protein
VFQPVAEQLLRIPLTLVVGEVNRIQLPWYSCSIMDKDDVEGFHGVLCLFFYVLLPRIEKRVHWLQPLAQSLKRFGKHAVAFKTSRLTTKSARRHEL